MYWSYHDSTVMRFVTYKDVRERTVIYRSHVQFLRKDKTVYE